MIHNTIALSLSLSLRLLPLHTEKLKCILQELLLLRLHLYGLHLSFVQTGSKNYTLLGRGGMLENSEDASGDPPSETILV